MADFEEVKSKPEGGKKPRGRSGTAYPYYNLDLSVEVARMIHERGGGECSSAHLASFLGYKSARSGTYLTRLSSAKLFGLVAGGTNALVPTERALAIINPVMPEDRTRERAEAFLEVPLFREIYERFRNHALPPEVGLKNLLRNTYSIVGDRIAPAARVFYESAEQAGFFETSPDRTQLIPPLMNSSDKSISEEKQGEGRVDETTHTPERARAVGGDGTGGIHSALAGLLRELPPPGPWDDRKKQQFLGAFTALFDFIYPSETTKEKTPDAGASDASA